jgi:DNA-binding HxlR family transcriptional regulator
MTSPGGDFNVTGSSQGDLPVFAAECPITGYPVQVGGRWGAMILLCLRARPRRFGVLRRHLPPVSAKVLAETLRSMERDGFVRRRPVAGAADHAVEYELSELGRSLLPVVDHAQRWGRAHLSELDRHRHDHDRAPAGSASPGPDAAATGAAPAAATCPDH